VSDTALRVRVLPAQTQGRYLTEDRPGPLPLLVGFHGYGENAETHLEQQRRLPGADRFRGIAVQALHRFYNTKKGEVVGSWMTRLDREQAIEDNLSYVKRVLDEIERDFGPAPGLVYVGFSQGAAMAYRCAARIARPCQGVVVLGGDLPPEVGDDPKASLPPVFIGRGTEDKWYTEDKHARDLEVLRSRGVPVEALVFSGGHEWSSEFLEAAGRFLEERVRCGAR
jgi:predicted esterase